ncbi:MAG: glycosyltransferase family 2 protein [Armatimonadetes bacterium]|nr:glycosyltransferase family 2 protein [Armatimonadota bacterium]
MSAASGKGARKPETPALADGHGRETQRVCGAETTEKACPLSVCIVTWNCREYVLECLRSISAEAEELAAEIIVVDNASTDSTPDAVAAQFPNVRLIVNPTNRGFAAANNQAIAVARGEFVLLLNPDTVAPPGALRELLQIARAHPEAGAIGPRLLNPDGSLQPSCRRFPSPWAAIFRNTLFGRLFPSNRWTREYLMQDWPHDQVREVDWVSGAAMLVRRQALAQVGLLDEAFFWGSEDVDYCKRLWDAGWKVLYTPTPAIVHRIGGSTDRAVLRTIWRRHASWHRLYCKHFAASRLACAAMGLLIWGRAALLALSWLIRWTWAWVTHPIRLLLTWLKKHSSA